PGPALSGLRSEATREDDALRAPGPRERSERHEHVTLHVWRVAPGRIPAALWRMAAEPRRLRRAPGVRFAKLLGTARGFGPTRADPTRWAALTVAEEPPDFPRWDRIAVAGCRLDLLPLDSRGTWSGRAPFSPVSPAPPGPVLAL